MFIRVIDWNQLDSEALLCRPVLSLHDQAGSTFTELLHHLVLVNLAPEALFPQEHIQASLLTLFTVKVQEASVISWEVDLDGVERG